MSDCHLALKNLVELKVSRESAWFTGELTSREGCLLVSHAQHYWGIFQLPSARPHHHHTPRGSLLSPPTLSTHTLRGSSPDRQAFFHLTLFFSFYHNEYPAYFSSLNTLSHLLLCGRHLHHQYQEGLSVELRMATHCSSLIFNHGWRHNSAPMVFITMLVSLPGMDAQLYPWYSSLSLLVHRVWTHLCSNGIHLLLLINLDTSQFFYFGHLLSRIQHNT